jgi:hypothetical protein
MSSTSPGDFAVGSILAVESAHGQAAYRSMKRKTARLRCAAGPDEFRICASSMVMRAAWGSAARLRTGTANQVIVVDVDHFLSLVGVHEGDRPV